MEFPPNPAQPLRIETLAPALIAVVVLATLQPFVMILVSAIPFQFSEAPWRVGLFARVLGAAPQIGISLAVIAAIGLFAEYYRAVRWSAIVAVVLAILVVPIVFLYALDALQVRHLLSQDQVRRFEFNALQTIGVATLLVPALLWFGRTGLQAGKKPPRMNIDDHLVVVNEPVTPGPIDPRAFN